MSVQTNQYVVYGYMLPYKETARLLEEKLGEDAYEDMLDQYSDSAYKTDIVELNGFSCLLDGMGGEYFFFGKIYAKSANYEPLNTMRFPKVTSKVKKELKLEVEKWLGKETDVKPELLILTHYR